jgi:hypothetical protein
MTVPGSQRSWWEGSVPLGLLISHKSELEECGMIDRQAGGLSLSLSGGLPRGGFSWTA